MNTFPSPFHFREFELFCEDIQIDQLINSFPREQHQVSVGSQKISVDVPSTPVYIYSASALQRNVQNYKDAMQKCNLNGVLGYALKANGNLNILKALKSFGVEMLVTVSGNEILAGLSAGFHPNKILLNGNGKQSWEIKLAIEQGILLNVDSIDDAERIVDIAGSYFPDKTVQVFLRLRPSANECDVGVHPFINTSHSSKFGFDLNELDEILERLGQIEAIKVIGIHCHLGSSITKPEVYTYLGTFVSKAASALEQRGITIEFLDVGGGIGINYRKVPPGLEAFFEQYQTDEAAKEGHSIEDFLEPLSAAVTKNFTVLVEPGRSLVGSAGILVAKVLGSKRLRGKNFIVVDGAMSELIRPCLYGSHHQIFPTKLILESANSIWEQYDVVGPICESSDFLGKDIPFQTHEVDYVAVMDCGAYAASMSSNYNMRPRPTEILITGRDWKCVRERDMFSDLVVKYF